MSTNAGKRSRMYFYTQRKIILFSDGTFAYTRKNKSPTIRMVIKPEDVIKLTRTYQNIITITTNYHEKLQKNQKIQQDNTFIFKLESTKEAIEWEQQMNKFISNNQ